MAFAVHSYQLLYVEFFVDIDIDSSDTASGVLAMSDNNDNNDNNDHYKLSLQNNNY